MRVIWGGVECCVWVSLHESDLGKCVMLCFSKCDSSRKVDFEWCNFQSVCCNYVKFGSSRRLLALYVSLSVFLSCWCKYYSARTCWGPCVSVVFLCDSKMCWRLYVSVDLLWLCMCDSRCWMMYVCWCIVVLQVWFDVKMLHGVLCPHMWCCLVGIILHGAVKLCVFQSVFYLK